jgi:hypothetical protein
LKNRLTFSNVIGILLDNKKKTYPQHQLVRSLFSLSIDDSENAEITDADNIKYSNWCNGIRPIPLIVCLASLSLSASGMEPEELLLELKSCGLNIHSGETV